MLAGESPEKFSVLAVSHRSRPDRLIKIWLGWILSVQKFAGQSNNWIIITHLREAALYRKTQTTY